jgi:N-acetylmuramoyl-L-alanine amidase
MKVEKHLLVAEAGFAIRFVPTESHGGKLKGKKPRFVVIHYTAGATAHGAVQTFLRQTPPRTSAHLVIDRDGSITQMVPFDTVGWHAGTSTWRTLVGLNDYSVGIELVNWGKLNQGPGGWKSYTGVPVPDSRVIVAEHRNHPGALHGWEIFDESQYRACVACTHAIVAHYGLQAIDIIGHDDIAPGRKVDPGPAFDMVRFRSHVFGGESDVDVEPDLYVVNAPSGLNMRKGPGIQADKITTLAHASKVRIVEKAGPWWLVAAIVDGNDDTTGWVHSKWLMLP